MHPKEYRKTKNGTGHFTHKSLINSELFIGIDFSNHEKLNSIINNPLNETFILYPDNKSINLNHQTIKNDKNIVLILIDSTWSCSKKILRVSKNLQKLKKVSFENSKTSDFKIKTQPNKFCLSTIESTQYVLKLLNLHKIEKINDNSIKKFAKPFNKMVEYQIKCADIENKIRYKK